MLVQDSFEILGAEDRQRLWPGYQLDEFKNRKRKNNIETERNERGG